MNKTAIWIQDSDNRDPETLGQIGDVLKHAVLPAIAAYSFDFTSLTQQGEQDGNID